MDGVVARAGYLLRDRETRAGRATNVALYLLNTVFVGLYVVSTYPLGETTLARIELAEFALGVVFLAEYAVRVTSATDPWEEVTDPFTVVDLVATVPALVTVGADAGFLRSLSVLRVFRFLRLLVKERQVFGRTVRLPTVRRAELSITIFLIFFVSTGFMYAAEVGANDRIATFGDAFYYTVIAVSTVGFGDITPVTTTGRWVTVLAVLVGFVLVPWQATRLRNVPPSRGPTCPRCGHEELDAGDRFCRRCGRSLAETADE
jgi:voltage-gated potassium channel